MSWQAADAVVDNWRDVDMPALAIADVLFERPAWHSEAACTGLDVDLFFPNRGEPSEPAKAVCAGCAAREPCLDFALTSTEKFGIWGGESERSRRGIRKRRRRAG